LKVLLETVETHIEEKLREPAANDLTPAIGVFHAKVARHRQRRLGEFEIWGAT
jgi:hypothetical protein